MRICYVAADVVVPYYRGASTHVYQVSKFLTTLGHQVHLISRRMNPTQPSYEVLDKIHVHRVYRGVVAPLPFSSYHQLENSREKTVGFMEKLYERYLFSIYPLYVGIIASRIIKEHAIEVIIERETSFGAGAIASAITRKPMVLEIIGPRYSRLSFKMSQRILAYTKSMIREPFPSEKLVLVTAAADVEVFKPSPDEGRIMREKYGFGKSVVIGYCGTFAKWHGIEELVNASVKVLKRFSDVRFLMVGPYFKYARELTEKRGIQDTYVFTGPVSHVDVPKYINASDILVAPYNPLKSELRRKYGIGSPLKVFEYMACAKPLITTRVTPVTEVVQDEKTGILIPPGDSSALAEAIIGLIEKPELRERIGEAARKEVEHRYSWRTFSTKLETILKEVSGLQ